MTFKPFQTAQKGLRAGQSLWKGNRRMAFYEHVFIVRQDITAAQVQTLIKTYQTIIEEGGGKVAKTEYWGLKSISYKIKKNRKKLGTLKYVMFTGKFAKHEKRANDEVDVLVVGDVVLPELAAIVREEEQLRATEINYTVMTEDEFEFRKTRRDPFLLGILELPRVMVVGEEEEMLERKPTLVNQ